MNTKTTADAREVFTMPKKPKIKSYEEYMKVAVEKAYGDTKRMTKEDWDNSVKV